MFCSRQFDHGRRAVIVAIHVASRGRSGKPL
jgi:hypothetical protein